MAKVPPVINTKIDQRDYNNPIYGMKGEFSLSEKVKVPYFVCLMDLKRITRELKTHEEVSPSLDTIYSLIELFQRQIDGDRVRTEIVDGYLRQQNKIKFFNSLTIALLPKDQQGKIVSEFEDYENNNPPIPDTQFGAFDGYFAKDQAGDDLAIFGGVQFVTTKAENLARLRWDNNRVDAVAVDGQHRLRALKDWMTAKNNQLSEVEEPTRVPVIFLMLHEKAGFISANNTNNVGIKGIAREIFTDLNKNARRVDMATEIILDDLSVESCCVRSLVTATTCTDSDELLPLSLLRWQEANNRFDQKYYLNSLVNLHLLVKDLLGLKAPDPMNKSDVLNFIKTATDMLGTGQPRRLLHKDVPLEEYYTSNYFDGDDGEPVAPFSGIPSHYLPSAVEGFKSHFSPWVLALLMRFRPYEQLIAYARTHELITGVFGQYQSQPKGHQAQLSTDLSFIYGEHWKKAMIDDHILEIEKIKGVGDNSDLGEQWAFKTIFQKSVVRLGKVLFAKAGEDEREKFGSVNDYLSFLNILYDNQLLRIHAPLPGEPHNLWTFIAVNYAGKKIKVSSTSEARINGLLCLWYFGWRYSLLQSKKPDEERSHDDCKPSNILKYFSTKGAQAVWPGVYDCHKALLDLFCGSAAVIEGSNDVLDEDRVKKVGKKRLEKVFDIGISALMANGG